MCNYVYIYIYIYMYVRIEIYICCYLMHSLHLRNIFGTPPHVFNPAHPPPDSGPPSAAGRCEEVGYPITTIR